MSAPLNETQFRRPRLSGGDSLHAHGEEQRTYWGRLARYALAPLFYWFDLLDAQRRPSHSKVMATGVFVVAMILWVYLTGHLTAYALHHDRGLTATEMSFLLAYAALMISTAYGFSGYKAWTKSKGGGTVEALSEAAKAESAAAIAARPGTAREDLDG